MKMGQELSLLCGRYLDPQVTDKQPMLAGAFLPRYDLHVGHSIAKFPRVQRIVNLDFSSTRPYLFIDLNSESAIVLLSSFE